MVSPSWLWVRGASANAAVPAAVAVDATAAAAAARRATVVVAVIAMGVAGATSAREVRAEDAPVADVVGYDQTSSTIAGGGGDVTYLSPFWEETALK